MQFSDKDIKRFWAKVNKTGPVHPTLGTRCWVWTACVARKGYGSFRIGKHLRLAHRCSWVIASGPITGGMGVLHRCDNPACVRPSHLFLGTHADNLRDCRDKGRLVTPDNSGENMGWHKLTWENVEEARRLYKRGNRWHPSDTDIKSLAKKYGVHPTTLSVAINGETWKTS